MPPSLPPRPGRLQGWLPRSGLLYGIDYVVYQVGISVCARVCARVRACVYGHRRCAPPVAHLAFPHPPPPTPSPATPPLL